MTLGGDKNYDTQALVGELRGMNITHVAQNNTNRRSAVDERTTPVSYTHLLRIIRSNVRSDKILRR